MRIKLAAAAALVTGAWLGLVAPHAHAAGTLSVTPSSIAFGSVPVGSSVTGSATVQNTGDVDVFFNGESMVAPGFGLALGSDTCFAHTLHPGDSCTAAVQFTPTALASYSGTFVLFSDVGVPNPLSIPVSGTGAPNLTVTPASIGFGSVPVGSSVTGSVTVQNVGSTDIFFNGESMVAPGFGLALGSDTCFAHTLHPGDSCTAAVQFTPTALASYSGTFVLFSDVGVPNPLSIPVSGTGAPNLTVTPASIGFGSVPVGSSVTGSVTVQNVGSTDIFFNGESMVAPGFGLALGSDTCFAHTLHPGDSCTAAVQFTPTALASYSGMFVLFSDVGVPNPLSIPVSGTGAPNLTVTPASIGFGSVPVGSSVTGSVTVQNVGSTDIFFNGESMVAPGFGLALGSDTCFAHTLHPGDSCTAAVQFTPTALASYSGMFVLFSDVGVPNPLSIPVSGTGAPNLTVTPASIGFGSVPVGSSVTGSVTVQNVGSTDIFFNGESMVAPGFGLALGSDTCFAHTLHPGDSCTAAVQFTPTALASYSGTFVLFSDVGVPNPLSIPVSGTGAPNLTVTPASIGFGSVPVGSSVTGSVTVQNVGSTDIFFNGESMVAPGFGLALGSDTCFAHTLHPGDSCTAAVQFTPTALASYSGTFVLFSDVGVPNPLSIPVSGTGAPNLTVTPTSFDFGSHPISSRNDAVVSTVQNVGSTDVFFNGEFGSGGDFFLSPLDTCFAHTLHPGDTCQLAAQFVPSALGTRNGSIGLTSTGGAPSPLVVPLTGVGTPNLVPSPASVDFGDVVIGTFSAVRHVTLQNLGTTTVSFDSFSVTPPFVLAANGC